MIRRNYANFFDGFKTRILSKVMVLLDHIRNLPTPDDPNSVKQIDAKGFLEKIYKWMVDNRGKYDIINYNLKTK